MLNFLRRKPAAGLFEELVERYQEPVYRFIRRKVGNHDDAADITQEVFIRVFRNLDSLKEKDAAKGWIFRIASNETMRFLADKYHSTHVSMDSEPLVEPLAPEADGVDSRHIDTVFKEALATLSDRQRNIFELRYFQEMSYKEIAEVMESNEATMKSTFHIARQKITEYITANAPS